MRVIALMGEPASGKTTVMNEVIARLGVGIPCASGLCRWIQFHKYRVVVLGIYDGSLFAGTDKLSMAVAPEMLARLRDWKALAGSGQWKILFEGDRLTTPSFFKTLKQEGFGLEIYSLKCEQEILDARHGERDNQNASWLKGRATKYQRLRETFPATAFENNTEQDRVLAVTAILSAVRQPPA